MRRPSARNPDTHEFNYFTQMGAFEWGGSIPDGNPASLPDNRLRMLINGRFRRGGIEPRGGQRPIRSAALHAADAKIRAMFDFQVSTPYSLYMLAVGCPTQSNISGRSLNTYDDNQDPAFMPGSYYSDADWLYGNTYSGALYLGASEGSPINKISLRRFSLAYPARGSQTLDVSGFGQDYTVATFPTGTYSTLYGMQEFDGKLYLCVRRAAAATSDIYTWDGKTLKEELLGVSGTRSRFELYRDSIILGFDDSTDLRIKSIGDDTGTWATVSATDVALFRGTSYKDTFYFTTRDEFIFSFDGTTITKIPIATTGFPAGCLTMGLAEFNGRLYVMYLDVVPAPDRVKMGYYDGSSWTAEEKDFADVPYANWVTNFERGASVIGYRGNLIVSTGTTVEVSPGTDTSGTYRSVSQGATPGDTFDFFPW